MLQAQHARCGTYSGPMCERGSASPRGLLSIHALNRIFERPIFKSSDFVRSPQIPEAAAKRILSVLKQEGILRVLEEGLGSAPRCRLTPRCSTSPRATRPFEAHPRDTSAVAAHKKRNLIHNARCGSPMTHKQPDAHGGASTQEETG